MLEIIIIDSMKYLLNCVFMEIILIEYLLKYYSLEQLLYIFQIEKKNSAKIQVIVK